MCLSVTDQVDSVSIVSRDPAPASDSNSTEPTLIISGVIISLAVTRIRMYPIPRVRLDYSKSPQSVLATGHHVWEAGLVSGEDSCLRTEK